jgi:hypothetical protein
VNTERIAVSASDVMTEDRLLAMFRALDPASRNCACMIIEALTRPAAPAADGAVATGLKRSSAPLAPPVDTEAIADRVASKLADRKTLQEPATIGAGELAQMLNCGHDTAWRRLVDLKANHGLQAIGGGRRYSRKKVLHLLGLEQ